MTLCKERERQESNVGCALAFVYANSTFDCVDESFMHPTTWCLMFLLLANVSIKESLCGSTWNLDRLLAHCALHLGNHAHLRSHIFQPSRWPKQFVSLLIHIPVNYFILFEIKCSKILNFDLLKIVILIPVVCKQFKTSVFPPRFGHIEPSRTYIQHNICV